MGARVINIHHGTEYDIYIGRAGKGRRGPLGNPIRVGEKCCECGQRHGRDRGLINCYRRWLWRRVRAEPLFREQVRDCYGKVLGCFCVDRNGRGVCHGFVLLRAAAWLVRNEGMA